MLPVTQFALGAAPVLRITPRSVLTLGGIPPSVVNALPPEKVHSLLGVVNNCL
jgi:hypothetical protein